MVSEHNEDHIELSDDYYKFFTYEGLDDTQYEDLWQYRLGGLHPVVLGDILPKRGTCVEEPQKQPRYRIHLKIGFGAFSTVWLGYDLELK